jgi:hypothetical protein
LELRRSFLSRTRIFEGVAVREEFDCCLERRKVEKENIRGEVKEFEL